MLECITTMTKCKVLLKWKTNKKNTTTNHKTQQKWQKTANDIKQRKLKSQNKSQNTTVNHKKQIKQQQQNVNKTNHKAEKQITSTATN